MRKLPFDQIALSTEAAQSRVIFGGFALGQGRDSNLWLGRFESDTRRQPEENMIKDFRGNEIVVGSLIAYLIDRVVVMGEPNGEIPQGAVPEKA